MQNQKSKRETRHKPQTFTVKHALPTLTVRVPSLSLNCALGQQRRMGAVQWRQGLHCSPKRDDRRIGELTFVDVARQIIGEVHFDVVELRAKGKKRTQHLERSVDRGLLEKQRSGGGGGNVRARR